MSDAYIRQLQQQNRLLKVILLGLSALLLMGQAQAQSSQINVESITTQRLRLVDTQGKPRANLFVEGQRIYLALGDSQGRSRAVLQVVEGADASLILADGEGTTRARLTVDRAGQVLREPK